MRDDFSYKTKSILARRVNYICSNPNCFSQTSGPHTLEDKVLNIGVAAHISAASGYGPRYKPSQTEAERRDISNGIWLCQNCAKLIDSDEHEYTTETLFDWKRKAEFFASKKLGKPESPKGVLNFEAQQFASEVIEYYKKAETRIDFLTKQQYQILNKIGEYKRVRISGCAGSGKTLVAVEAASRFHQAGYRVMYLCHNPNLSKKIKNIFPDHFFISDFVTWYLELSRKKNDKNEKWTIYAEPTKTEIEVTFNSLIKSSKRYDIIIVDEAQDFRSEWWDMIEAALYDSSNSRLLIFSDNKQALLPFRSSFPLVEVELELSRNCRNTGRIYELIRFFNSNTPESDPILKDYGEVSMCSYKSENICPVLRKILEECMHTYRKDEIVVLACEPVLSNDSLKVAQQYSLMPEILEHTWQDEIRTKFFKIAKTPNELKRLSVEYDELVKELENLSDDPYPNRDDVFLVIEMTKRFKVDRSIRNRINTIPAFKDSLKWTVMNKRVMLTKLSKMPTWNSEIILHLEKTNWENGLPKTNDVSVAPYFDPKKGASILLYDISAYKGLESKVVIVYLNKTIDFLYNYLYVGFSRAKHKLIFLVDENELHNLPKGLMKKITTWN